MTATRAPLMRLVMRATWSAPIMPTPSTAMRKSDMVLKLLELDRRDATRPEVAAGALSDWQWLIGIARVHVLFHDREHVDAELFDGVEQRRHVRDSARGFDHRAELDRLAERQILRLDLGAHLGIDLLELQVPDAVGCPVDDRQVVAAAIADVAGVQAQVHEFGVRSIQEAVDVLLGVDVAVGVRMVLRSYTVLFEHRLAEVVHAPGLLLPLLGGEIAVLEHLAGGGVAP